jgi:hypothetical protein
MKVCYRVAGVCRQVKRFAAIAAERAAQAERIRAAPSFRALAESETETILVDELPTALAGARRRA